MFAPCYAFPSCPDACACRDGAPADDDRDLDAEASDVAAALDPRELRDAGLDDVTIAILLGDG